MLDGVTVLMVDPGKRTGWACSDGTGGAEEFGRGVDKLPEVERHALVGDRFARWLATKLTTTQAGVLGLERQMTHNRAHLGLGLRMLALHLAWRRSVAVVEVNVGQWRPWAKRCGWWSKDDELDARAMLGWFLEARD